MKKRASDDRILSNNISFLKEKTFYVTLSKILPEKLVRPTEF